LGLVRDYLDLARLEQGHLQVRPRKGVDLLEQVVLPALEIIQPQMDEKGMTLRRKFPAGCMEVECDPALMGIVFINLLGNAVKYGNEGGTIELSVESSPPLHARVTNEGPGFQEHERNLLFRKFSRIPAPALASRKGSGVGLYTTWWIVNHHGGKIWADSEPGHWARFTFEIPQPLSVDLRGEDGTSFSEGSP
jgi:signal transduction histidine kinase